MEFGNKLKHIRRDKNLSQNEMSDLLFMSQSNYCKYETNKKKPSIELLQLVSSQLKIPINELLPITYNENTEWSNPASADKKKLNFTEELLDSLGQQLNEIKFYMKDILKRLRGLEKGR